ncbi:MAG: hypothetical protein DKM50_00700 [Candidatus Margulisiibacteriota bacterium]|nr:MAG: hypothetical protein A2X43_05400 [Candidatus Margulisbacteria bacterium GWD2_39_127]OGI04348.1 MAG: hypothetical protein A2X42_07080 [Candidatus Margulisbacteria bacterium GWF2_38_17]OGI07796.1 MAG: hypothetical protein A2X41_07890 [Candidatus Margulisbacteria bacterium GWE2_39_32]PZM84845.1 MAG: hypothetical protein DKM50_00700 [Candidatus Margulisiibacteriota bacterium]HAR63282.1 hypothetical protein [Candidatus Margulisiibacteriota bacterium]
MVLSKKINYEVLANNNDVKLEGVVETARAVCHELCQPLQGALTFVELLLQNMPKENNLYDFSINIKQNIDEIANITRKLNNITKYEIKEYVAGVNIIDIHKASSDFPSNSIMIKPFHCNVHKKINSK